MTQTLLSLAAVTLVLYALLLAGLALAGRRADAAAYVRLVPDLAGLFVRLLRDPRVLRSRKLLLGAAALYLVSPIDIVPDFLPVIGVLDDAIVVALTLRLLLSSTPPSVLADNWRGPQRSLALVMRAAAAG